MNDPIETALHRVSEARRKLTHAADEVMKAQEELHEAEADLLKAHLGNPLSPYTRKSR